MPRVGRLEDLMKTEVAMQTVAAHNEHENLGRRQWGGTAVVAYGDLAVQVSEMDKDPTGLGHWCSVQCKGQDDHTIRIITAYNPVYSTRLHTQTVYSQQQQYFELRGDNVNPHQAFLQDFEAALRSWWEAGDILVVFINMNENYKTGAIDTMLRSDGLDMSEAARTRHPMKPVPPTFVRGNRAGRYAMDGCYVTLDLIIKKAVWPAIHKGQGDHRMPIIEVEYNNCMGENVHKIIRPPARRLTCRNKKVLKSYNTNLEKFFSQHKFTRKLHEVYAMSTMALSPAQQQKMTALEISREEGMLHAEKKCRHLSMGDVDWSQGVQDVRDKLEVWNLVVQLRQGRNINPGRIRRAARKAGIVSPLSCSLAEAIRYRRMIRKEYKRIKPKARALQKDYLYDKTYKQQQNVSELERKQALWLLREECQREAARYLRRALGKVRAASVDWIEEVIGESDERRTVQYTDRATVEDKIMQNNEKHFWLTENLPPMIEPLQSELGFLADTEAARRILNGTYIYPPELDEHTVEFLKDMIPMMVSSQG